MHPSCELTVPTKNGGPRGAYEGFSGLVPIVMCNGDGNETIP